MTPTPNQLHNPILLALGKLSGFLPDVEVGGGDVSDYVLANLGYVPEDEKKARNNLNFAATQKLRPAGLLSPQGRRGFWALTQAGVEAAQALSGLGVGDTPPPPVSAAPARVSVAPAPDPESPWANDPVGVVIPLRADAYTPDEYIRTLGITSLPCFGGFRSPNPVCDPCPLAGSCQSHQFATYSSASASILRRGATPPSPEPIPAIEPDPSSPPLPPGGFAPEVVQSLADIMGSLTEQAAPAPVEKQMPAPVDSVCFLCHKRLPEKSVETFVVGKGFRHTAKCV